MLRNFSGYKSLPCRGACGCGGCGAAGGGVSASGTSCAPINALGGWARSISRCLFLRSCSFTPWSLAIASWKHCKQHYTCGQCTPYSGAQNGTGGAFQRTPALLRLHGKQCFWGNWCRESGSVSIEYTPLPALSQYCDLFHNSYIYLL